MANRIIMGAALSLALILSPGLASSVSAKPDKSKQTNKSKSTGKSKSSASKSKSSASNSAKKSGKSAKTTKARNGKKSGKVASSRRGSRGNVRRASARSADDEGGSSSSPVKASVLETPPLIRVVPQRDGRFLIEPLSPKKPGGALSNASPTRGKEVPQLPPTKYLTSEPWNFSELIMAMAQHYKGSPYARGANLGSSGATDCSGFVQYIYQGFKIDLPRSSAEQAQVGKVVTRNMDFSKLLPGDLLYFRRGGRSVGHAGIYLGEGKMIHASNRRLGITVTDLRQDYYEGTFVVAKRVFEVKYPH
jgi:cell wall-associated NlpC family hydrolase